MKKFLYAVLVTWLFLYATTTTAQSSIDLQGTWQFAIDRSSEGVMPQQYEETIKLPGSMLTNGKGDPVSVNTQWVGSLYDSSYFYNPRMEPYRQPGNTKFPFFLTPDRHYVGNAWYQRTVVVPKAWKKRHVTLYLERPHIETTVYVNGREVGHQMSLSVPHQYDITDAVKFGKKNTITIKVYNGIENVCVGQDSHSVTDQTQGDWNGIAGRIELRTSPLINRLRVNTDIKNGLAHILLNDTTYDIRLPQPLQLWSETTPYLYTERLPYRGDTVTVTFGLRDITTQGPRLMLNGKEIKLRGTVENCCFPETGYPPTDVESWLRILGKCKAYGLNHVRFHSFCPPDAAFQAADQLGLYLQPEGPSWPNHGVRLRRGMAIDQYLTDECKRIVDTYGHHPSFVMLAAGNEPAGDWVAWGKDFVAEMRDYDPSRLYCTASVGGGWAWDEGSDYHVKGGARGLEWDRSAPQSTDNFNEGMRLPRNFKPTDGKPENNEPCISHELGQWCAFPDLNETTEYTGAYKAANFEIFADLLKANDMEGQARKFLMSSGRLQTLAYKYDIERNLRTRDYAGFQMLSLNDYSGQGTALVGVLNVHWHEKGYCTANDWREFCAPTVPLALWPRFVYNAGDTLRIGTMVYDTTGSTINNIRYTLTEDGHTLAEGTVAVGDTITYPTGDIDKPTRLTLRITAGNGSNHYECWVYPNIPLPTADGIHITDTLDSRALDVLRNGGKVLICAGGKIRYGNDIRHHFLPVFWNTSWFKMRPPHTTGTYIQKEHPVFADFPTDDWQNLNWWELTNRTQVMNLALWPTGYQPIVQPIDTWHISRKLGMMAEANVSGGRLLITTLDLQTDLAHRPAARQLRLSLLRYMQSERFQPTITIPREVITHLFEHEAPSVDMFTKDSPDELKPKLK
ncbi:MAG: beta-glucuronidase [Prevotella sp.]|nr:beta-glucuronidase [Prevotella sp.]